MISRILALVLAGTMLLALSACGEKLPEEKTVWLEHSRLNLSTNIKSTYEYDEYGNQIKASQSDAAGNVTSVRLYEYDENSNLIRTTLNKSDGTSFVQLEQIFDENGNLTERREYTTSGEHIFTYQYDEQNRPISVTNGGMITETYIYNDDGSYKVQDAVVENEYSLYDRDGNLLEVNSSHAKTVYTYDDAGNHTETAVYTNGNLGYRTVYELDENQNPVKMIQISANGRETALYEYEYREYTVKIK